MQASRGLGAEMDSVPDTQDNIAAKRDQNPQLLVLINTKGALKSGKILFGMCV